MTFVALSESSTGLSAATRYWKLGLAGVTRFGTVSRETTVCLAGQGTG